MPRCALQRNPVWTRRINFFKRGAKMSSMDRRPLGFGQNMSGGQMWAAFRDTLLERLAEAVPRERDYQKGDELATTRG